jgi:ferric-dicitrate binding protein FerR (iron transport regulator)
MTDKELIDGFLRGELDEAGMAQLEAELAAHPELLRELCEQRQMEQALHVLFGDESADQQVAVSVLGVLRSSPVEDFKTDLLKKVQAEDERKRKESESDRIPAPPAPEKKEATRPVAAAALRPARFPWLFRAAAGIAACAAVALGAWLFTRATPAEVPVDTGAYLLTATAGVTVQSGAGPVPASAGILLPAGYVIRTADGAEAKIGFADGVTRVDLKGGAEIRFLQGGSFKKLDLRRGAMEAEVAPQSGEALSVTTSQGELKTSDGRFRLQAAAEFARVEVRKGSATLSRENRSVRVGADHFAVAGPGLEMAAKPLDPAGAPGAVQNAVAVLRKSRGGVFLFTQSPADRTPAKPGQPVLEGQSLQTEGAGALAVLEYPDQTRLEVGADAILRRLVDPKDRTRKDVRLEQGMLGADVAKQPAGRPMTVGTAHATVTVVGTRFTLAADSESARLQVEEGAVRFLRASDRKEIEVRSGFGAVAAPNRPFEPSPVPGGAQYLELDLSSGVTEGDGEWSVERRRVRQSRAAGASATTHLFKAGTEEGVVLEAVVEVEPAAADASGEWGFGVAAAFRDRNVVLRTRQGAEGGSVFEFKDVTSRAFEHGREGTYRLKLLIERPKGAARAKLQGKLWQGDLEPDGWMIEFDELELQGPMTHVGFQTLRCACSFDSFRVKVLRQEP